MQGWIKLHRKLTEWEWYKEPKMVLLFVHLLLMANHEPKKWQGIDVQRGQVITGLDALNKATGISYQSLRTCLSRLENSGNLTSKSTNRFRIITLCNYETYQIADRESNKPTNKQLTNKQQAGNKQLTANKNVKKEKNEKNEKKQEFPAGLNVLEFHSAWLDWEQHRTEIKHPLTPTAISKQLKMLSKYSIDNAIKIIEASIRNQWRGLFEDKLDKPKQKSAAAIRAEARMERIGREDAERNHTG